MNLERMDLRGWDWEREVRKERMVDWIWESWVWEGMGFGDILGSGLLCSVVGGGIGLVW